MAFTILININYICEIGNDLKAVSRIGDMRSRTKFEVIFKEIHLVISLKLYIENYFTALNLAEISQN